MFRILFVVLLISPVAFSQSSKVTSGIVAYDQGDYASALEKINTALKNPQDLKDKQLYKAWLYKGKSLSALYSEAVRTNDADLLMEHLNNLIAAYDCYQNAYKAANEASETREIDQEIVNLVPSMLQMGLFEMNNDNFEDAKKYFDNCMTVDAKFPFDDNYLFYGLSGQNGLNLGDSTRALVDFTAAINVYQKNKPATPDFMIGYTYYRSAIIHYYHQGDVDNALDVLDQGIAVLDAENKRRLELIKTSTNAKNKEDLERSGATYEEAIADLKGFQLDLLLNSPDKYTEALAKFKKETEADPTNATVMIAYGNLLEKTDLDAGYEVYLKALTIDPNNATALYNAGANRVNKGVYYANLSNEEIDFTRSNELRKKTDEAFKMALPHFQKYHKLKPDDLMALGALLQITAQLELTAEYDEYLAKRKVLRGF